jgi:hypothetical protein
VLRKIVLFFLLILPLIQAGAQIPASGGEDLTLKIAVMGPGDELYLWWGHIALIIEDSASGINRFYDYGLFSFENEHFFLNFAFGRLLYSCGASTAELNIAGYTYLNRDITIYTLDVPPEKREEVREFAEYNVLPENRDYYYHHFRDNCSTRIRDIIDIATDGQFSQQYRNYPGRYTLRQHVRRHTWHSPIADWLLNFLMGQDIDTPITVWDEMFLPSEVGDRINEFWYTDSEGVRRKLVSGVEIVNRAKNRPQVLDVPLRQWPQEFAFGLALSVVFGFFFFLKEKKIMAGRVLAGISQSLTGLFFGIAGLVLYFMSLFTNHDYTYHNLNMLFATPLLLAAVPLGILYAVKNKPDFKTCLTLRVIWLLTLLGIMVSITIKVLPSFWQQNLTDELLMLPIVLVFALEPSGLRDILARGKNGR